MKLSIYSPMKIQSVNRVQIFDEAICITLCITKGMNLLSFHRYVVTNN